MNEQDKARLRRMLECIAQAGSSSGALIEETLRTVDALMRQKTVGATAMAQFHQQRNDAISRSAGFPDETRWHP